MTLDISPRFIGSVATIYTDINRVFMEFIDNSLDAAEEFYDNKSNTYSKEIDINIKFSGRFYDEFFVEIKDNCKGIADLERVVKKIGNSNKKDIPQVNGQFGFGMYSFLSVCEKLIIMTCYNGNQSKRIEIHREIFEKDTLQETEVSISSENNSVFRLVNGARLFEIGTTIRLQNFDKDKYKQININELKREIEKHFEILLKRNNLRITLISSGGQESICLPFDYEKYKGETYYNKLVKLEYMAVKKTAEIGTLKIDEYPVVIFIKVTNEKAIDRRPFFVIKGRRITEISDVKAFRTNSKSLIWSHPNITGYIDVTGCLEPTIARNEFRNTKIQKALFHTLLQEESKIKEFIDKQLKLNLNSKFKKLESILENTLNDVANELSQANKHNTMSEKDMRNLTQDEKDNFQIFKIEDRSIKNEIAGKESKNNPNGNRDTSRKLFEVHLPSINNTKSSKDQKKDTGQGLNIKIDCENEPLRNELNQKIRSSLNGNEIIIYQKHPEFLSRLDTARDGIPRLTTQLINYLSSEILLHYKILEFGRKDKQDDVKEILLNFSDALYCFEKKLNSLEGKKLSEFK